MSKTSPAMPRASRSGSPRPKLPKGGAESLFPRGVHDLDSFGRIPIKSKFARFAGSRAADRPAQWRLRPAEAKGHAGHDPEELVLPAEGPPGNWPIGSGNRHIGVLHRRCDRTDRAGLASIGT